MKDTKKSHATPLRNNSMNSSGSSLLAGLLAETKEFCEGRKGRVSQLAEAAGVAQPHVSAWLHGKVQPGGESTLRIQAWLEQERSKEALGRSAKVAAAPDRLKAALLRAS